MDYHITLVINNSFRMARCYQIKFSLDCEPLVLRSSDHYVPTRTRHSSFIMRLRSQTKNKISKYQRLPRRQSLLDELSICLNTPISKNVNSTSR